MTGEEVQAIGGVHNPNSQYEMPDNVWYPIKVSLS
jgi:hypothetical protein